MSKMGAILAASASVCSTAAAQVQTYQGPGGSIPDIGTIFFEINVPDHLPLIIDNVTLDLIHTWSGDLRISVLHGAEMVVLVDRLGVPQSVFGNSNNFTGVYEFRDGHAPLPEAGPLPPGVYGPDPSNALADLHAGADAFGPWVLMIEDFAVGDVGTLGSWSVSFQIPSPAATTVLLGVGAAFFRRRRGEIA